MSDDTTDVQADEGFVVRPDPRPGPGSGPDLLLDGDPTTSGLIAPDPAYPPILVLGRDTCEDTIRSRDLMNAAGIPYVYRNVELDADADAWNRSYNNGERVTPVILIGDPHAPSAVLIEPTDEALATAIGA